MTGIAPPLRLIGYARVSTNGQTLDAQLAELRRAGCADFQARRGRRLDISYQAIYFYLAPTLAVLWTIAVCMSATPVAAQDRAPATTAFDGTYVGVSRTFEGKADAGAPTRNCVPNGQPGPLTIAGGVARYSTLRAGNWEGSVKGQGVLVMHSPLGEGFNAQIDGRGTVIGRFTGECSYHMVWQKEGK